MTGIPRDVTRLLAEFAVQTTAANIPKSVFDVAKVAIADAVGTVPAGRNEEGVRLLREMAVKDFRAGQATVIGCNLKLVAAAAALINASSAHALDYDSINIPVTGFITSPMLFAMLAVAEEEGNISGRRLLESFIVGWEVTAAVARGLGVHHYAKGWHSTATLSHIGSAVSVAHLLGLNVSQTRNAIGIVCSEASGLRTMLGNMVNAYHVGKSARNGVNAARLAQNGFTAHQSVLETDWGFFNAFNGKGQYDVGRMLETLGEVWDLVDPGLVVKLYPCCGLIHSALDGTLDLMAERRIGAADVSRAVIAVHELVPPTMCIDRPETGYQAKFSTPFCIATALREGSVELSHFTDEIAQDPKMQQIMSRVEMVVHPDLHGYETFLPPKEFSDVRLELSSGEILETRAWRSNNRGYQTRPLTPEQQRRKFLTCTSGAVSDEIAGQAFDVLMRLEEVGDVSLITSLLG
jgi:2-methylcitrate dehydratase PrpD